MPRKESHANRGKEFESRIEDTNRAYEFNELALVQKIPCNWVVQRDYKTGKINNAWPSQKSTVDYCGVYKSRFISFEAKKTNNKTSFPLANVKEHQTQYLKQVAAHGGLAFFLIHFATFDRTFLLPIQQLQQFLQGYDKKSIPFNYFEESCIEIYPAATMPIDYIKGLEKLC